MLRSIVTGNRGVISSARSIVAQAIRNTVNGFAGDEIRRTSFGPTLSDQPEWINAIISRVQPFTMTSPERLASLCNAIEYITRCEIAGDLVECGVWKGGSVM